MKNQTQQKNVLIITLNQAEYMNGKFTPSSMGEKCENHSFLPSKYMHKLFAPTFTSEVCVMGSCPIQKIPSKYSHQQAWKKKQRQSVPSKTFSLENIHRKYYFRKQCRKVPRKTIHQANKMHREISISKHEISVRKKVAVHQAE